MYYYMYIHGPLNSSPLVIKLLWVEPYQTAVGRASVQNNNCLGWNLLIRHSVNITSKDPTEANARII